MKTLNNNEFVMWLKSDNVVQIDTNLFIEQTTQWRVKMSRDEIYDFFMREFINV